MYIKYNVVCLITFSIMLYIHKHTASFLRTNVILEALLYMYRSANHWAGYPLGRCSIKAETAILNPTSEQQRACCTIHRHQMAGLYQKSLSMEIYSLYLLPLQPFQSTLSHCIVINYLSFSLSDQTKSSSRIKTSNDNSS